MAVAFCDVMRQKRGATKIFVMSGSPAPNTELEYFPQMRCLSPDILGKSFYAFRNGYFQSFGYMGHQWRLVRGRAGELQEKLQKSAIYIDKKDCLDLPEQLDKVLHVPMNPAQTTAYRQMVNDLISSMTDGSLALAQNTAVKAMKLRQITSGFLRPNVGIDDAGEPIMAAQPLQWLSTAKIAALLEVAEDTAPKRLLIWINFHAETDAILEALRPLGTVEEITGRTPAKDRPGVVQRFRSGETRFLVAHPRAAGHGLTLVECDTACYFSLSYSWEDYKQSRDRLHRAGQRNAVTYIHLLAPKTIDEDILRALRRKEDASAAVLEGLKHFSTK
jgi:SNF2 family DNA or RNA helicase